MSFILRAVMPLEVKPSERPSLSITAKERPECPISDPSSPKDSLWAFDRTTRVCPLEISNLRPSAAKGLESLR
jgi:hypothetical protein